MLTIKINGGEISVDNIKKFLFCDCEVKVEPSAIVRIKKCRAFVEEKLGSSEAFYGINTGFGSMANKRIPKAELEKLQENLIISHAVGVGNPLPKHIVRLMVLLRANVLAIGHSGIRPQTLDLLIDMINKGITPIIPEQGSVGASGDLAPLSHLALAMIGRGDVLYKDKVVSASSALKSCRLKPIKLAAKEGIALINGTQAMAAIGAIAIVKLENLLKVADIVGAMSIEGDRASRRPFDARIHKLRPHPGQIKTASNVRDIISGSSIIESHANCKRVQDPYSFRCIPQVHGAVKDACTYSRDVILRETGCCTDNPLIFADDDEIISGGNFHGEPLAFALDMLAIATAELGSISERRVAILLTPLEGEVPVKYLVLHSGLNSGLAPMHVTQASLVSENKTLAHPASVDSIPTFGGQEDHVSMGYFAARKALTVINNVETILAIELFAAAQAIDLQMRFGKPGKGTKAAFDVVRELVPFAREDREFQNDIMHCSNLVKSGSLVQRVEDAVGEIKI